MTRRAQALTRTLAALAATLAALACGGGAPPADQPAPSPPEPSAPAEEAAPMGEAPAEVPDASPSAAGLSSARGQVAAPEPPAFDLDAWLDALPLQDVVFNAPDSLRLHERVTVWLRLQPGQDGATLQVDFEAAHPSAEGTLQSAPTRLAPEMEASLVASGLQVTAESPLRQAISRREATEWRWSVEATEPGPHTLLLTLSAVPPGSSALRPVKTLERALLVVVSPVEKVASVVKDNWEWMWTFLGAPVGGWAWARWRRRKRAAATETDEAQT